MAITFFSTDGTISVFVEDGSPIAKEQVTTNVQHLALSLFSNEHFSGEGVGDFAGPSSFDIVVRSGEFTIKRPL